MKTISEATATVLLALTLSGLALLAQSAPTQEPGNGAASPSVNSQPVNSKVRIVRLSQVNGQVQLDRRAGSGFATAMQNLPVTEGARLQTEMGVAEVEFEDNSTLRLTPDTLVEFSELELRPTGAKVSLVHVVKGTVYASLANTKGNEFRLSFGDEKLILPPSSHIRLQVAPAQARLAVFQGNVQIDGPSGMVALGKKKTLVFDLESQDRPTLAKNVAENEYDNWDQKAVDYHKSFMNSSAYGNVPYSYGLSDMNYYGAFVSAPGCGAMWQPYFVSPAWDPYSNGVWAWYPGAGYSWVSPYPWGWTPYHYGSWGFCQGLGWGWTPGGSWMGLANVSVPSNPLRGPREGGIPNGPHPVMPPRPPISRQLDLVSVNQRPLAVSTLRSPGTFVFRNDSAGLGIPRGSLGKLGGLSRGAERRGSVSMPVYSFPISTAGVNGRPINAGGASALRHEVNGRTESGTNPRSSASGVPGYSGARRAGSMGGSEHMGSGGTGSGRMGAGGGMGAGGAHAGASGGRR